MAQQPLTETVQNYLVYTLRLRTAPDAPVPLSQLAEALSVSPISVNDMCRKLQDQGLMTYRPYHGALLTEEGQRHAFYIIRRHRLWEVFLVDKLGFGYDTAHEAACSLEHSTPDEVADRLDAYLAYPAVNPEGDPIPRSDGILPECVVMPLSELSVGSAAQILRCQAEVPVRTELEAQGLRPGATVRLLMASKQSLLLALNEAHISLARPLATRFLVQPLGDDESCACTWQPLALPEQDIRPSERRDRQVPLDQVPIGRRATVVRLDAKGPLRRRLLDMGLVPGVDVDVVRVAPLGDPIELQVKGYSLSLRREEVKSILVEIDANDPEQE